MDQMVKVAIVEDDKEIREGLAVLIHGSEGFQCVAAYSSAEDALSDLLEKKPDVVLMDINLPHMSGIECTRKLKELRPDLSIMVLTVYDDDESIFESLKAGARGYILKKTPSAKLLESILELHNGGSPISSRIARRVVQTFQVLGTSTEERENLSRRENEILSYLAKGYRYKEIAETLFISIETVRTHVRNIYEKLHVRSRTEAVLKAFPK
jgi:DNA-binding NarL/FixJ family response regulator